MLHITLLLLRAMDMWNIIHIIILDMERIRIRIKGMWLGVSSRMSPPRPPTSASSIWYQLEKWADGSTLSNPNTSEEAKKHAREELKKMGVEVEWFTDCRRECDRSEVLPVAVVPLCRCCLIIIYECRRVTTHPMKKGECRILHTLSSLTAFVSQV